MVRALAIVFLVCGLIATGVAGASHPDQVRVPVTLAPGDNTPPGPGSVVVQEGDHLWEISARHLGDDAEDREVAPYWREVVDVNTPRLRSGDPDLIYPGEIVELPAIPERR